MTFLAVLPYIASAISAVAGANASGRAANASASGQRRAIGAQQEMLDLIKNETAYQREAGRSATDAMLSMVGLPGLSAPRPTPRPAGAFPIGFDTNRMGQGMIQAFARSRPWRMGASISTRGSSYGGSSQPGGTDVLFPLAGAQEVQSNMVPGLLQSGYIARAKGGQNRLGRRYLVSEYGQPELTVGEDGQGVVTNTPTAFTANTNSTTIPLSQTGSPQVGNPIAGSSVLENPGGQPGRYNFMTDPGYGFRFDEGQRAIERSAAARGMGLSGSVLKELARYGQGIGSQEYGNVYGRLSGLAGMGQTATGQLANAAYGTGANIGQNYANIGSANAAGTMGRNSAYQGALSDLAYQWGGQQVPGATPGIRP